LANGQAPPSSARETSRATTGRCALKPCALARVPGKAAHKRAHHASARACCPTTRISLARACRPPTITRTRHSHTARGNNSKDPVARSMSTLSRTCPSTRLNFKLGKLSVIKIAAQTGPRPEAGEPQSTPITPPSIQMFLDICLQPQLLRHFHGYGSCLGSQSASPGCNTPPLCS